MTSSESESPPPPSDAGELFAPPSWLARTLVSLEIACVAAALASIIVLRVPVVVHLLVPLPLLTAAWIAHRARRLCHVQYLVGERSLTQLIRGELGRALAFAEVTDFREVPSHW